MVMFASIGLSLTRLSPAANAGGLRVAGLADLVVYTGKVSMTLL